jgi:TPR repeat protein
MTEQQRTESAGILVIQSTPAEPMDKFAQYELAWEYLNDSDGSVKDWAEAKKAVAWFREAAEQGDEKAVAWLRKTAEQGLAEAQYSLGEMYANGRRDDQEATVLFRKAAEQGHADAQFNLGMMYKSGRGVPHDDKKAVAWYRKAAEQEHANAQLLLGWMYANGEGVAANLVAAYALFSLAAKVNPPVGYVANRNLGDLAKKMPAEQVEAGRRLSQEMSWHGDLLKTLDAYLGR